MEFPSSPKLGFRRERSFQSLSHGPGVNASHSASLGPHQSMTSMAGPITAPSFMLQRFKSGPQVNHSRQKRERDAGIDECKSVPSGLRSLTVPALAAKLPDLNHSIFGSTALWPFKVVQSPRHERNPIQQLQQTQSRELTWGSVNSAHSTGPFQYQQQEMNATGVPALGPKTPRGITPQTPRGKMAITPLSNAGDGSVLQIYVAPPPSCTSMALTNLVLTGTDIGEVFVLCSVGNRPIRPFQNMDVTKKFVLKYPRNTTTEPLHGDSGLLLQTRTETDEKKNATHVHIVNPTYAYSALVVVTAYDGEVGLQSAPSSPTRTKLKNWKGRAVKGVDLPEGLRVPPASVTDLLHKEMTAESVSGQIKIHFEEHPELRDVLLETGDATLRYPQTGTQLLGAALYCSALEIVRKEFNEELKPRIDVPSRLSNIPKAVLAQLNSMDNINNIPHDSEDMTTLLELIREHCFLKSKDPVAAKLQLLSTDKNSVLRHEYFPFSNALMIIREEISQVIPQILLPDISILGMLDPLELEDSVRRLIIGDHMREMVLVSTGKRLLHHETEAFCVALHSIRSDLIGIEIPPELHPPKSIISFFLNDPLALRKAVYRFIDSDQDKIASLVATGSKRLKFNDGEEKYLEYCLALEGVRTRKTGIPLPEMLLPPEQFSEKSDVDGVLKYVDTDSKIANALLETGRSPLSHENRDYCKALEQVRHILKERIQRGEMDGDSVMSDSIVMTLKIPAAIVINDSSGITSKTTRNDNQKDISGILELSPCSSNGVPFELRGKMYKNMRFYLQMHDNIHNADIMVDGIRALLGHSLASRKALMQTKTSNLRVFAEPKYDTYCDILMYIRNDQLQNTIDISQIKALSLKTTGPFTLKGKEYTSIWNYIEEKQKNSTSSAVGTERLGDAVRALVGQSETVKLALLDTDDKIIVPSSEYTIEVECDNQYCMALTKTRQELRKKLGKPPTSRTISLNSPERDSNPTPSLFVSTIEVYGYEEILDVTPVATSSSLAPAPRPFTKAMRERVSTPFYLAGMQGDNARLRYHLEVMRNNHSQSVIQDILKLGLSLDTGAAAGSTCLHAAAKTSHLETVNILLDLGDADPGVQNYKLSTPLHAAAKVGCAPVVEAMMRKSPEAALVVDCQGSTPLMVAVNNQRKTVTKYLLSTKSAQEQAMCVRGIDGASLLHIAAKRLDIRTIRRLEIFSELSLMLSSTGDTPIHFALQRTGPKAIELDERIGETVDLLSENGVDILAKNSSGETAAHVASTVGLKRVMLTLITKAGNEWFDLLCSEDNRGCTPLMRAAAANHADVLRAVLSNKIVKTPSVAQSTGMAGSSSQAGYIYGWSEMIYLPALATAAENGHAAILREFGGRVNQKAYQFIDWGLALLRAANTNNTEIVKYLLDKEIQIIPTENNLTEDALGLEEDEKEAFGDSNALHVASRKGHIEIVEMLLEGYQSQLIRADDEDADDPLIDMQQLFGTRQNSGLGKTALLEAISNKHLQTVEELLGFAHDFDIDITRMDGYGFETWHVISKHGLIISDPSNSSDKLTYQFGDCITIPSKGSTTDISSFIKGVPVIAIEETPLHAAVSSGLLSLVKKIHEYDSTLLEKPDKSSYTALHLAVHKKYDDVIGYLLSMGADPFSADNHMRETVLHGIARWEGDHKYATTVLDDVLAVAEQQFKPYGGDQEIESADHQMSIILQQNDDNMSALEIAAAHGSVTVVEWILHIVPGLKGTSSNSDPSSVFRKAFIITASSKYLDSAPHMSVINAMLKAGISIPYDAVPQSQSPLSLDSIRVLFTSLINGLRNESSDQVLTIPLHQHYNYAGMLTGRLRSCQILLGLSQALQEVSVRDCPFSWIELCYPMYSYVVDNEDSTIQADFIQTQSGIHVRFQVISSSSTFLMRMNPSKRYGGQFCYYGDENMAMRSGSIDRYGFVYIDEMENLDIELWVKNILDNDCIEYQKGTSGKGKSSKKIWMPLVAAHHHELSHTYSEARQRCSVLEMKSRPMGCDIFDHYFYCLSADHIPETFTLFKERHETTYPSHGTTLLMSEVLMNTLWSRIVQPNSILLTHLDIQGVVLSPAEESLLEDWITHTSVTVSALSNLSILKYTSGTYGDISVSPSLGDGLEEVRPLASLVTGSNNFTLDLNFVTCTQIDLIMHHFVYSETTDSYTFASDEDLGKQTLAIEEEKRVHRAEVSLRTLLDDRSISIENFHEQRYRKDILKVLSLKKDRKTANEALDILSTFGKGIMVDVSQFQQRCSTLFDVDAAKGLLEYVKRHTAVQVIRFQNLNFLDDGESTVPREFVQMKLLRGLSCKTIDFGSDNRHVGEIFLAAATFSPELYSTPDEGSQPRNTSTRRATRLSPSASPGNRQLSELAQSGLTPLHYFTLENVKFIVSDSLRKYPLQYLIKLLHERKRDCEAGQGDDVAVADYTSAAMMLRRATIKTSPLFKIKEEAENRLKTSLYQDTLNVLRKTINYLNSRDPCYFLDIPKKKCDDITPLRLAIHFGLDEVVECMIGQQKAQGGLLKRSLCYETERLELDHYVDIWGCKERDKEGLLPIHASLIYIGVTDYDDNVAFGGRWDVVGSSGQAIAAPRNKQPYHIRTGATAAGFFTRAVPYAASAGIPSPMSPASPMPSPAEASFGAFNTAVSQLRHDQLSIRHPSFLVSGMSDVTLFHRSDRLTTYLDTAQDLEPDIAKLGIRVFRHVRVAKQLIACSFMERSISVSGNPPPRGCKQYIDVPPVIDEPEHSYFATSSGCTERLILSRTWDRMGVNSMVHSDYSATTLLIALKFAPYCVSSIMRWGDAVELFPKVSLPSEFGDIQLQHRREFKSINIINDEPILGKISWEEVDGGLNLIHWAAARDQKRLLERAVNEHPASASARTEILERAAMHYSCYAGSIECLNILINNPHVQKNDIHSLDTEGNTPLHVAASLCHPICIKPLMEAGAKPYWRNKRVSGSVDAHDCSIALLLHHSFQEKGFYKENLSREWERDHNILRDQITLLNKDPRIQRKLALQATKIFLWEATFYFLFLAVLCMVAHNKTNLFHEDAYFLIQGFRDAIRDEEVHFSDSPFSRTLITVGDTEELHDWLAGPFTDLFDKIKDDQIGTLTVVGSVRLRQLRVKAGSCSRPSWIEPYYRECYGSWTSENELSGGTYQKSTFVSGKADPSLYGWASQMDINYPNTGYVIDTPVMNITSTMFRDLQTERWIDLQTRALFVEFNIYNPSAHRFLNTRILFEITNYGGCHSSMRLTHIKLESCVVGATSKQLSCHTLFDSMVFFLEICLLLSVLILTYDEACDVWESWLHVNQSWKDDDKRLKKESKDMEWLQERTQRKLTRQQRIAKEKENKHEGQSLSLSISKKVFNVLSYIWIGLARYFWRDWNLVDLLSVLMFWLVVGTRGSYISATVALDAEEIITNKDTFFDLWEVAALTVAERELWALVLVLYFVKLLKYIMILPKLGSVANAITATIGDSKVLIFFVVFMVISIALMLGLHLLLGTTSDQFKSFKSTLVSFTQIVFGQWDFNAFQESWLVGPLLFMLTLFLANLVLINVFIAVVGNIYEENLTKSVERWSWQIIDHYQYQLTRVPKPRGTGNPVMVLLGKVFRKIRRRFLHKGEEFIEAMESAFSCEEFPARIMRKEAVSRLLKTRQRIQTSLAEVYENVDGVKHNVQSTASSLDTIHEQLDKLDSSLHQLHSAQDELRRAIHHGSTPSQPPAFGF